MMPKPIRQLLRLFLPNQSAGLALLFGGISVAAFAPIGFAPAALVALAGLFWLWYKAETLQASIQLGLWFGLGQFGLGVSWLISSMYLYSGMSLPLSVLVTGLFVLFMSLFVAMAGSLVYFFRQTFSGLQFALVMPLVWVFAEWVRSSLFGGFPFLLMGVSHLNTWLDGYAPLLGVLGVSWMVALSAGLLVWLYQARNWLPTSLIFGIVWVSASYLKTVDWVTPVAQPVDIALVQGNIAQDQKWLPSQFVPSLKSYVDMTRQNMDAQVVVWPETAVPAYYDLVEKGVLKSFIVDAQLLNTDILFGVIARNPHDANEYYNAIVNAHHPEQVYQKHHLVPFSEYFPFHALFKQLTEWFDIPFSAFTAGAFPQPLMQLGDHKVGLSVCYEMAFGTELARTVEDARYFITVSNDAWFAHTLEPAQQLQEVQMRALELGREIARSTNTGLTAIVDIKGQIKAQIEPYQKATLRGKIQPYEGMTPFAAWQNMPLLFLFSVLFGFLLIQRWLIRKLLRSQLSSVMNDIFKR